MIEEIVKVNITASIVGTEFGTETYKVYKQTQKCLFTEFNRFMVDEIGVINTPNIRNTHGFIMFICLCLPEDVESTKVVLLETARKQAERFLSEATKVNNDINNYKL